MLLGQPPQRGLLRRPARVLVHERGVNHAVVEQLDGAQVVLERVPDQDRLGRKHLQQLLLHVHEPRAHVGKRLGRDAAPPRVVVDNLALRQHERVVQHLLLFVHDRDARELEPVDRAAHLAVDRQQPLALRWHRRVLHGHKCLQRLRALEPARRHKARQCRRLKLVAILEQKVVVLPHHLCRHEQVFRLQHTHARQHERLDLGGLGGLVLWACVQLGLLALLRVGHGHLEQALHGRVNAVLGARGRRHDRPDKRLGQGRQRLGVPLYQLGVEPVDDHEGHVVDVVLVPHEHPQRVDAVGQRPQHQVADVLEFDLLHVGRQHQLGLLAQLALRHLLHLALVPALLPLAHGTGHASCAAAAAVVVSRRRRCGLVGCRRGRIGLGRGLVLAHASSLARRLGLHLRLCLWL
eukprot:Unigene14348_Nuclearia_a/m.43293 Unigene14348_Nuclearia_a/g.43293  ORF Unigene14348_Nuclearia_a/g.43293 Unigene14348_Nuclearia_a/m.43293 type:complete len:407 (+) Unigene14348_Nuclearia_a:744-1964(+)